MELYEIEVLYLGRVRCRTKLTSGVCITQRFYTFLLVGAPNLTFCVPSQFVSWSAQPLEPPIETYVSALHDM